MNTSQSVLAKLCIEPGSSPHTFDTSSEPYDLVRESLAKHSAVLQAEGNRGSRSRNAHRRRNGPYRVSGMLALDLTPRMLSLMLPRILGANASGTTYAVADSLPSFGVLVNRVNQINSGHFQYTDCKVDRCLIVGRSGSGQPGSPNYVRMYLYLVGLTEITGTSYPSLTLPTDASDSAYAFGDQILNLQGANRRPKRWALMINNFLLPRQTYSLTPDAYYPGDRSVVLDAVFPWDDDHDDLHDIGVGGTSGSLTLTNGNLSTAFNFAQLDSPANSPSVPGRRNEIDLRLQFLAAKTDSANEIEVINDNTP